MNFTQMSSQRRSFLVAHLDNQLSASALLDRHAEKIALDGRILTDYLFRGDDSHSTSSYRRSTCGAPADAVRSKTEGAFEGLLSVLDCRQSTG